MPNPTTYEECAREFIAETMIEKYGENNVTPELFQKEMLKFIKNKMPGSIALRKVSTFINEMSNDMVQVFPLRRNSLAQDKSLYPYQFYGDLLIKSTIPSKKVMDAISSKVTAEELQDFCQEFTNGLTENKKNIDIENKMNKFKIIEACKPQGNAFTRFFKKLFNIGGYNQKMDAYESCKRSFREYVGNELTDEEFEKGIKESGRFSSTVLESNKQKHKPLEIKENDIQVENKDLLIEEKPEELVIEEKEIDIKL